MKSNITNILFTVLACVLISCNTKKPASFLVSAGSNVFDECYGLAIDSKQDIIISGVFSGEISFKTSSSEITLKSKGLSDFFVAKYSKYGVLIWVKSYGGIGMDESANIAIDKNDNIYVTGYFTGTTDFLPNENISFSASFLLKLTPKGKTLWANKLNFESEGTGVVIKNNYVYWNSFGKNMIDSVANSSHQIICTKLNLNGEMINENAYGNFGNSYSKDIAFTEGDHLFITGIMQKKENEFGSAVLLELDSNLNLINQTFLIDSLQSEAISVLIDKKNNKYVTGSFMSNFNNQDAFICKLNQKNELVWKKTYKSAHKEWTKALVFDKDSNIVFGIVLNNGAEFSDTKTNYKGNGSYDIYISKINSDGNELQHVNFGDTEEEGINKMILDSGNNLIFCGWFYKTLKINDDQATSNGEGDAFLAKKPLNKLFE
jgi:hypothetical protein